MYRVLCRQGMSHRRMGLRIHEPVGTDGVVEKPGTNSILDLCNCVSELLCNSLTLQSINGI